MRRRDFLIDAGVTAGGLIVPGAARALTTQKDTVLLSGKQKYVGLLDSLGVSSAAAFSVRLLRTAYTGKCCNIRRSSDNATQDIGFLANGNFDAAIFSSFIGGGNGFVTKWYDQSGNGRDASQATAANQPQLVLNVANGRPALVGNGTSTFLATASFASGLTTQTLNMVATRTAAFTTAQYGISIAPNQQEIGFRNAANSMWVLGGTSGTINAAANDSAVHSATGVINGASSVLNIDGSEAASTVTGSSTSGAIYLMSTSGGASGFISGNLFEAIDFASALPSGNRSTLAANQTGYY